MDINGLQEYIATVISQYSTSSPVVANYADEIYMAIEDGNWERVSLLDIITLQRLHADGSWYDPNYAQNTIYKLLESRKQATGIVSY